MKKVFPYLIGLVLAGFLFYSCDDTISGSEIDNVKIPDSNVGYQKYIQPIFNAKCGAVSGCHDDRTQSGGLSLSFYAYVTANSSIVMPGNPGASKLIWAIKGGIGASIMPPRGVASPLTDNQIKGIETWIREGAQNN